MVRQMQAQFHGSRYSQTTLERKTDFSALAKAFGAEGFPASNLSELGGILERTQDTGLVLVDCKIGEDEKVLPLIPVDGDIRDMVVR